MDFCTLRIPFLAAIFLTDDITRVLRYDIEHVLLSKIARLVLWRLSTAWVGLLRRPGQGRHVLRLVCVWS